MESIRTLFKIPEIRGRILWSAALLVVFRIGSHIPLPGVHPAAIQAFVDEASRSLGGGWDLLNVLSGGALGNLALFSLGIMPYITASIIVQLMTKVSPALEAIAKEGAAGRRKIQQYTRYATIPVCLLQACMAVGQLRNLNAASNGTLLLTPGLETAGLLVLGLTAGSCFVVWLGEQITERGLGNGASLLIMAGIVARIPSVAGQMRVSWKNDAVRGDAILVFSLLTLAAIVATVFVSQAQRRIPLQHAKHIRGRRVVQGGRNYLPLRVNTAGVMPIIFASTILVIPQLLALVPGLQGLRPMFDGDGFPSALVSAGAILFFSYFWTYLFFRPDEIALQLREAGSFIPGIRPGENTAGYLNHILGRITLCGAAFLGVLVLLPNQLAGAMRLDRFTDAFLGGSSILIVVGVVLDLVQKLESSLLMHGYSGFLGTKR